jgi:hypothetical protein
MKMTKTNEEKLLLKREHKKFDMWRKKRLEEIPTISNRVYALRNKDYMGCGLHYSMEASLGLIINTLNNVEKVPWNDVKEFTIYETITKVKFESLLKDIEEAEKSIEG